MNENKRQLLLVYLYIAIFCFSLGLWENYNANWLKGNGFSIQNISLILSGCLIGACLIIVAFNLIFKKLNAKPVIMVATFLKFAVMTIMAILFQKNISFVVIFILFIIDTILSLLIINSIYPLVTHYAKSDKIYSVRKLIEYTARDIGLAVAMIVIGFFAHNFIEYNIILIIAVILTAISFAVVLFLNKTEKEEKEIDFKGIFKDKITVIFLINQFIVGVAYNVVLGLQVFVLSELVGIGMFYTSVFLLVACVIGDGMGFLMISKKFNPKKLETAYFVKFGSRVLLMILVACTNNAIIAGITIFVALFFSRSFENKTNGTFVNRISKNNLFAFSNMSSCIHKIGQALGVFLSGVFYAYGLWAIFLAGAIFNTIYIIIGLVNSKFVYKEIAQNASLVQVRTVEANKPQTTKRLVQKKSYSQNGKYKLKRR